MATSYLALAQNTAAHPNPYAADAINNASALNTLAFQTQQQNALERQYRRDWWKRGLVQGGVGALQGALQGAMTGNPAAAAAGAGAGFAGGFGGEAGNHFAFKDQNAALGSAGASLGALAGRGMGSYLGGGNPGFSRSDVADEVALGNLKPQDLAMLRAQGLI